MSEELEEIRKRKMEQLMRAQAQSAQEEEGRRELEEQKQAVLRQILTPEARERLNSIRMTKPDIVEQVEAQLILLVQSGRIKSVINDVMLKQILQQIMPKPKDFNIRRV